MKITKIQPILAGNRHLFVKRGTSSGNGAGTLL